MSNTPKRMEFAMCRFCGQNVTFETDEPWEDEDAGGGMHCECEQARQYRLYQELTKRAYAAVENVCITDAARRGFDELTQEHVDKLKTACDGLLQGTIEETKYRISDGDTIQLKLRKSRVVVKRVRKIEMEAT